MPKAYIFDYGATLDTGGNHWGKVIWHAYERIGMPVEESHYRDAYVYAERRLGSHRIIMPDFTFRQTLDVKLDIQLRYLCENGFWNASSQEMEYVHSVLLHNLYDGVGQMMKHSREVLSSLRQRGLPMVLVSNFYGNVNTVLEEMGIHHLFEHVVESAVVGIRKPDPRIFQLGVDALGLPPCDIMVVGDSISKDIAPAKSIGCTTAWIKGEPWSEEESDENVADIIISDLSELL